MADESLDDETLINILIATGRLDYCANKSCRRAFNPHEGNCTECGDSYVYEWKQTLCSTCERAQQGSQVAIYSTCAHCFTEITRRQKEAAKKRRAAARRGNSMIRRQTP